MNNLSILSKQNLADINKKELIHHIKNLNISAEKEEDIKVLNLIILNTFDMFYTEGFSCSSVLSNSIKAYFNKMKYEIIEFIKHSSYQNEIYKRTEVEELKKIVKNTFDLEIAIQYLKEKDMYTPSLKVFLSKIKNSVILKLRKDYNNLIVLTNPLFGINDSLEDLKKEKENEFEDFRNEDFYFEIKDMFYKANRVFNLMYAISGEYYSRQNSIETKWDIETETKKDIAISFIKTYYLSLENNFLSNLKYQSICHSILCNVRNLNLEESEKSIQKRVNDELKYQKKNVYRKKLNEEEEEQEKQNLYDRYKNDMLNTKELSKNHLENISEFMNFLDYSNVEKDNLSLIFRKKGLGLFGEFSKKYDKTFLLKKIEDRFDLFTNDGKRCSFRTKESFLTEIKYCMPLLYPEIKEEFIVCLE